MIRVILNGAAGRMGKALENAISTADEFELVAKIDQLRESAGYLSSLWDHEGEGDVIIDFSHHSATESLLDYAVQKKLPVLIATTGHTSEELDMISEAANSIPIFHSANMSLGVAVLVELAKKAAVAMPDADIEIVETHHNRKLDAPSGTALMIAKALRSIRNASNFVLGRNGQQKREKNDIGISAVRRGNIVGIHEVILSTDNETLSFKHEAHSRALFADGALPAAKFLVGKPAGIYEMGDLIAE